MHKLPRHIITGFLGTLAIGLATDSSAATLTPSQSINVSEETTNGALNSVVPNVSGSYFVRSRQNQAPAEAQIVSFIQFDLSSLTGGLVSDPNFEATFNIDFVARLNTVNNAEVLLGRNTGPAWDDSGTNNPLHDDAFVDETNTVVAADTQVLLNNIRFDALGGLQVDVTDIVTDWVNGANDNNGFALVLNGNIFQGAGFDNASLTVTPEPTALVVGMIGLGSLAARRRRR